MRAYATNSAGTNYGNEISFTTSSATTPALTTTAASSITQTSATSGGNVTSDGGATVTARGVCWNTSANPTLTNSKTSDGTGTGVFSSSIAGLTLGTTYYMRAYATNSAGTNYGNEISFTTSSATTPALTTTAASSITQTSATSGGNVTSDGGATVTARGVCWNTSANPTITNSKTSDGTGTGVFSSSIAGLTLGTTYYVRAYATNSAGTSYGTEVSFATTNGGTIPILSSNSITGITSSTATCGGNISNDGGLTVTERGVCWSIGLTPTLSDSKTIDGAGAGSFSSALVGLNAGTTYFVRAYATNSSGTGYGMAMSFITLGQVPTASTLASTSVATTGSTLNGTVNANYLSSTITFEYGTSTSYGSNVTASQSPVTGNISTNVSANIASLVAGTTYHYRVIAVNSLGTIYGNDMTFTTLGQAPTVSSSAATSVTTTGATLNGTVNANYLSTTVSFEYGLTLGYGQTVTAMQSPVTGNTITNVNASITGLSAGTTYYYRVIAINSLGTNYGNEISFTTVYPSVNDVDGNTYNVVAIGTQVWMAENLKTTKYKNGTAIPLITDLTAWMSLTTPGYCWYDATYGALYNFYTLSTGSLCPTGWHIPSDAEWTTLTDYLGGETVAGGKLKETGTAHWTTPNSGATNAFGFKGLPGVYVITKATPDFIILA